MNKMAVDWTKSQRQSPAALLILLYKALISLLKFLWPLLLVIIIRKKSSENKMDSYEILALVVSILSLARSGLEYFNFRFSVVANELIIKKGFFTKQTITLPLEKIQVVHAEQSWLHSLLNVSSLSFDTAGSEKTEGKIEALDKFRSSALKEFILGQRTNIQSANTGVQQLREEVMVILSGSDLFKLSISANHLEAFFLLLAFIYSSLQSVGVSDKEYSGVLKWLMDIIKTDEYRLFLFLAITALVVSIGISVIKVMLTYSDFTISRSEKGFRIRSGLINKKEKFVPFRKIQFVSWKANWIRQKIGLFLLQFHATGADYLKNKMQVNVPVTRPSFIPDLLEQYHSLLQVKEIPPIQIDKVYIRRRVLLLGIMPAVVAGAILYFNFKEVAFFISLWIVGVWIICWLFQRKFRLWPGSNALQIKKGIFGSYELILKWDKIQSVRLEQSLYQQKHNLATVKLCTAGGNVTLPYLAIQQARHIQNYALYKIESSPWS
jgi:putative membrane protein